jgi:cytoskeletal protein CcmA (bactofilin family)
VFKFRKPEEPFPHIPSPPLPSAGQKAGDTPLAERVSDINIPPNRIAAKEQNPMARPPLQPGSPPLSPATPFSPPRPVARAEEGERRTLVVGRGISLRGTVTDCERLVVEGVVESDLVQAREIEVAIGGTFKGGVEVEDAVIAGLIEGTVTARGSLFVKSTGRVTGTAHCRRLQVEDGGQITGQIQMITGADTPSRAGLETTTPA